MSNHLGNVLNVVTDRKLAVGDAFGDFDGSNDRGQTDSIYVANPYNLTMEAWVRTSGTPSTHMIISAHYPFAINKGNQLVMLTDGKVEFDGKNGSSTLPSTGRSTTAINDGQWHHIAGTYDNGVRKIYVDGVLEKTNTYSAGSSSAINDRFYIASNSFGNNWNGEIRDVSYWSVTKTGTEIAADMANPLANNLSALIGYWPLSDGFD